MAKGEEIQKMIRRSIQTEKEAMHFYRLCASQARDPEAKRTFERLSAEEREHAAWFHRIYKGGDIPNFEVFMDTEPEMNSGWLSDLEAILLPILNHQKALELAMEKELWLEKQLKKAAQKIVDPEIRKVYEANAEATRNHYRLIEAEYDRLLGRARKNDIDAVLG